MKWGVHGLVLAIAVESVCLTGCEESLAEGTWVSEEYGLVLEVRERRYRFYELSKTTCFVRNQGVMEDLEAPVVDLRYELDAETNVYVPFELSVHSDELMLRGSGTFQYPFERREKLPKTCEDGGTRRDTDSLRNLDVFFEHFWRHHAFIDTHGVDLEAERQRARAQVTKQTTPDQLFAILSEFVTKLGDEHVFIATEDQTFSMPLPEEIADHGAAINEYLRAHYVEHPDATVLADGLISYRHLSSDVGYVMIRAMMGYGDLQADDPVASEIEAAGQAIDQALRALADTQRLIVDVRFNQGGLDAVALEIANRFADRRRSAFSKYAWSSRKQTPSREFILEPEGTTYGGEVKVLTSRVTISAAEVFLLAMRELPNVELVGETTVGAFSDVLDRHLPNGWRIGVSNEIYTSADGHIYEARGVPPDRSVALEPAAFAQGRDAIVEAVLAR